MNEKKKIKREKEIPKKKLRLVENLAKLIGESMTIIIVSIKNLPTSQFQLIKKKLRGKARIMVVKKSIINRAIDKIGKEAIKNLKKHLKEDIALMFSKLDAFELSAILSKNKSMARAKIGQRVDEDITVEAGPTELIPGPVVSELGNLGIKFAIEDGKINIKESKAILKSGEEVNESAASIMAKLDMRPIAVGLEPLVAYDSKTGRIYENIKVDSEKTIEDLKTASSKALGFAVKIAYFCKKTIKFLFGKAKAEGDILSKKIKTEKKEKNEENKEEKNLGDGRGGDNKDSEEEKENIQTTKSDQEENK